MLPEAEQQHDGVTESGGTGGLLRALPALLGDDPNPFIPVQNELC